MNLVMELKSIILYTANSEMFNVFFYVLTLNAFFNVLTLNVFIFRSLSRLIPTLIIIIHEYVVHC